MHVCITHMGHTCHSYVPVLVMYALVVWVSTRWMGRVDMSQKILNPSPQVLKAWQLVAGRINVISNSNVYPFLLELLGFMQYVT